MSTIPTKEPSSITAGDTVSWDKSLSDYPATEYTLTYQLAHLCGWKTIEITSTANLSTHQVRLLPVTTADFDAGDYRLIPVVKDIATSGASVTVTLDPLRVKVKPPATSDVDGRSEAEITLAQLKETYSKLSKNSLLSATVAGRTYNRYNMADLRNEIIFWENRVKNEQGGSRKHVAVTFRKPS